MPFLAGVLETSAEMIKDYDTMLAMADQGHTVVNAAEWLVPLVGGRERDGYALTAHSVGGHEHVLRWLYRGRPISQEEVRDISKRRPVGEI